MLFVFSCIISFIDFLFSKIGFSWDFYVILFSYLLLGVELTR